MAEQNKDPPNNRLAFQVPVVGEKGAGKSAFVRAALHDAAVTDAAPEEEADGLRLQRAVCDYQGIRVSVDLVEFPSNERYAPILSQFCAAAACVVFVVNLASPSCLSDLEERISALGGAPRCGLAVANLNKGGQAPGPEDMERLERLRELAGHWSMQVVRFESLEQLERGRVLRTLTSLVLHEMPDQVDSVHLMGRNVSHGQQVSLTMEE